MACQPPPYERTPPVLRLGSTAGWFVMVKDNVGRFSGNKLWGDGWGWSWFDATNPQKTTSSDYTTDCQSCHVLARQSDWIYTHGYPALTREAGHGVDDVSLVKPLPCTEQFGKRGHVDHWRSAVPPSLSEATHGPWHEMSHGLSNAATFPPKRQMTAEKFP